MKKYLSLSALLLSTSMVCPAKRQGGIDATRFVTVKDGHFVRNGKPYYYVGANLWYGAILGSEGTGGNRKRLIDELDSLKAIGVNRYRPLTVGLHTWSM